MRNAWRLLDKNAHGITALLICAVIAMAIWGGDLLHVGYIGFEVVFPFFAALAVGEWGKTRADENFGCIAAQCKSLFSWVFLRFASVFLYITGAAFVGMAVTCFIRRECPLWELLLTYFGPAFFLASLCAVLGLCVRQEHAATMVCGALWLLFLLCRSLLRLPLVEFFYLFIRLQGDKHQIWLWNKAVLTAMGVLLWGVAYLRCKRRRFL